jgi:glycine/D-amino acid oxidase-like deaminating enzyme
MAEQHSIAVAGAGIFGLSAALELGSRGHAVTVVDPGPVPHPLAASNDVSRMIRMDYGDDKLYSDLGAEAIDGWHAWNDKRGKPLYHEDGFLVLISRPLEPGAVERQSYDLLRAEGWPLERLNSEIVADRYPLWNSNHYTDGYFNPRGGWGEAGETVSFLAREARAAGIEICTGFLAESVLQEEGRAVGLRSSGGSEVRADAVVVAAGVWTTRLIPELADMMDPVAQTLVYLRPTLPDRFKPPHFPPWGADISRTGWYGFPANSEGVVKLANHGPGRLADADDPRDADPAVVEYSRRFLSHSVPELANAPLAGSRACFYNDTWDGDFYITRHPGIEGLTVSTGGSGHAFKFTPALGRITADVVEGKSNRYADRFAWRPRGEVTKESIRYHGD